MKIELHLDNHAIGEYEKFEVESVLASTEIFPYWMFRYPQDKDGDVKVRFLRQERVQEVNMIGQEEESKLASVTSIRGGE